MTRNDRLNYWIRLESDLYDRLNGLSSRKEDLDREINRLEDEMDRTIRRLARAHSKVVQLNPKKLSGEK